MAKFPADLSKLRVLISNDDGIESEGLALLEKLVRQITDDVWVCAPSTEQSATSHSLTLFRPVKLTKHSERRFSVSGTPTDCVLLGVHKVVEGRKPDLMVSGINRGRNLGDDITYSGTVAAAMEAAILGIPAIAFSQHVNDWKAGPKWDVAEQYLPGVLQTLLQQEFPPRVLMNVNFPDRPLDEVKATKMVRQGRHNFDDPQYVRNDPDDSTMFWMGTAPKNMPGQPDTDIGVILEGGISVTPIGLDLTAHATLENLRSVFA